LKKYLDINDLINSIRLEIRNPISKNSIWIVVEGISDIKLYSKFFNKKYVHFEEALGGEKDLTDVVITLYSETKRVIGIRDADFIRLEGMEIEEFPIFLSDHHDSEMMIIVSDSSYKSLLSEYCNSSLDEYDKLRIDILRSITFIAGIRWINWRENLKLNLKNLKFGAFFNAYSLELNKSDMLEVIHSRSPNKLRQLSIEEVEKTINDVDDLFNLCNGHDFIKVFSLYASYKGNIRAKPCNIASSLRCSFAEQDFQKTLLYKELKKCELKTGFVLF